MAAQNSDEAIFSSILKSMGIMSYDPLVITALNEYARRYAGNLLSDAKDYAEHADRSEIELEDMQIAVKLSDERTLGLDPRQRIIHQIESDINTGESRDLLKLLNRDGLLHRYPPNAFSQRCYSYIPGIEAFPELPVSGIDDPGSEINKNDNAQKKRTASFSFHSSNSESNKEEGEGETKKIKFQQTASKDRPVLDPLKAFGDDEIGQRT